MPQPIRVTYQEAEEILEQHRRRYAVAAATAAALKWEHQLGDEGWLDAYADTLQSEGLAERCERHLVSVAALESSGAPLTIFVPGRDDLVLEVA